jgi:aryl-alcohol dehydrogenase-like predicted oxidoreductase
MHPADTHSKGKNAAERIAERKRATLAQIALAWLMAQKPFIVPIPSSAIWIT